MTEKTTVKITAFDGNTMTFSGDSAIVFTIEKADEFLAGEVKQVEAVSAYVGKGIPQPIFAETIGVLVRNLIEKQHKNPTLAAYYLHETADILEARSKEIMNNMTPEEKLETYADGMTNILSEMMESIFRD